MVVFVFFLVLTLFFGDEYMSWSCIYVFGKWAGHNPSTMTKMAIPGVDPIEAVSVEI